MSKLAPPENRRKHVSGSSITNGSIALVAYRLETKQGRVRPAYCSTDRAANLLPTDLGKHLRLAEESSLRQATRTLRFEVVRAGANFYLRGVTDHCGTRKVTLDSPNSHTHLLDDRHLEAETIIEPIDLEVTYAVDKDDGDTLHVLTAAREDGQQLRLTNALRNLCREHLRDLLASEEVAP
jgi:hypothetical protein